MFPAGNAKWTHWCFSILLLFCSVFFSKNPLTIFLSLSFSYLTVVFFFICYVFRFCVYMGFLWLSLYMRFFCDFSFTLLFFCSFVCFVPFRFTCLFAFILYYYCFLFILDVFLLPNKIEQKKDMDLGGCRESVRSQDEESLY